MLYCEDNKMIITTQFIITIIIYSVFVSVLRHDSAPGGGIQHITDTCAHSNTNILLPVKKLYTHPTLILCAHKHTANLHVGLHARQVTRHTSELRTSTGLHPKIRTDQRRSSLVGRKAYYIFGHTFSKRFLAILHILIFTYC